MILSASVNLFDGHELLIPLLRNLRNQIDHLSVIYQTESYWGQPAADDLVPLLDRLSAEGWIDSLQHYPMAREPLLSSKEHEARKRTAGLELALQHGATHYLSLDCDEFYRAEDFSWAKQFIVDHGLEATLCSIQEYHARPIYRRTTLEQYLGVPLFVPFICALHPGMKFNRSMDFFWAVDPSRRLACKRWYSFTPDQLLMHHMSSVRCSRQSLISKFVNSASRPLFALENPTTLAEMVWNFDPSCDPAPVVTTVADAFGIGEIRNKALNVFQS